MSKYGIDNVRGGSYVQITLDDQSVKHLQKEFQSANNLCFNCNESGHFVKDCKINPILSIHQNNVIENTLQLNSKSIQNSTESLQNTTNITQMNSNENATNIRQINSNENCKRCGRKGHQISKCYAKTNINGFKLKNKLCERCGRENHKTSKCFAKTHIDGSVLSESDESFDSESSDSDSSLDFKRPCVSCNSTNHSIYECKKNNNDLCYRCGGKDHTKLTCCATHDVNGYPLREHIIGQIGSNISGWIKSFF